MGLGFDRHRDLLRHGSGPIDGLCDHGAPHRSPLARCASLPDSQIHRRCRVDFRGVLQPFWLHLSRHPVLPIRQGLLDALGRRAHPPVCGRGGRRDPLGGSHRAEARHPHRRGDRPVPHGRRSDGGRLQLRRDDALLGGDHRRHDPARTRTVLHHGAVHGGCDGFSARRAARCGGRSEQHHEGARRHVGRRRLRLDLRLVLRATDHQRLSHAANPGGAEGISQPIHGGSPGRGPPRTHRGAATAGHDRRHGIPQRTSRRLHRGRLCRGHRRRRCIRPASRTALLQSDCFGFAHRPALSSGPDRGADADNQPDRPNQPNQLSQPH